MTLLERARYDTKNNKQPARTKALLVADAELEVIEKAMAKNNLTFSQLMRAGALYLAQNPWILNTPFEVNSNDHES